LRRRGERVEMMEMMDALWRRELWRRGEGVEMMDGMLRMTWVVEIRILDGVVGLPVKVQVLKV
jgi:hypothetical protein